MVKYVNLHNCGENTIATSPINMVGIPSQNPSIILLFPKTYFIGLPLPVAREKKVQTIKLVFLDRLKGMKCYLRDFFFFLLADEGIPVVIKPTGPAPQGTRTTHTHVT